jgi:hypothetical protein
MANINPREIRFEIVRPIMPLTRPPPEKRVPVMKKVRDISSTRLHNLIMALKEAPIKVIDVVNANTGPLSVLGYLSPFKAFKNGINS